MSLIPFTHRVVSADTGSTRERRLCFFGKPDGPNPEYVSHDHEADQDAKENTPRDLRAEKNREKAKDLDPRDALKDLRAILKLPGSKERKISALRGFIGRRTNELNLFIDRQRFRLQQTNWQMTKGEHGRFTNQIKSAQRDIFTAQSHLFHLSGGQHGRQTTLGPQSPDDRSDEERESSQASIDRNTALNQAYKAKEELNLRIQDHASRQVKDYYELLPKDSPLRGPDGKVHIPSQLQEKRDRSKRMRTALDAAPNGIIPRGVLGTPAMASYTDAQIYRSVQAKHAEDNAAMNQRGRDIENARKAAENNKYLEQVKALGPTIDYPELGNKFSGNAVIMKALNGLHATHTKLVEDANKNLLSGMPGSSQGRIEDMQYAIKAIKTLSGDKNLLASIQSEFKDQMDGKFPGVSNKPHMYLATLGRQIERGQVKTSPSLKVFEDLQRAIVAGTRRATVRDDTVMKADTIDTSEPDSSVSVSNTIDTADYQPTDQVPVSRTRQAANDYADKFATNSRRYDSDQKKFGGQMTDALNKLADDHDRQDALRTNANAESSTKEILREMSINMMGTNPYSAMTITVPNHLGKFRNTKITYQPNKSPPIDNGSIDVMRNAGIILEPEQMSSGKIGAVNIKFTKPGKYFVDGADAFSGAREKMQVDVDPSAKEVNLINEAMTSKNVANTWGTLENGNKYTRGGKEYYYNYYFDKRTNKLFAHSAYPDTFQYYNRATNLWEPATGPRPKIMDTPPMRMEPAMEMPGVDLATSSLTSGLDKEAMQKQLDGLILENEVLKKEEVTLNSQLATNPPNIGEIRNKLLQNTLNQKSLNTKVRELTNIIFNR